MIRLLSALLVVLALAVPALAQPNDITGTWTYSSQSTRGETAMVYIMSYQPGGRLAMQQVVPGLTKNFVGRWGFDGTTLQYVLDDWEPKQDCGQGFCYPIPSGFPIGQVFTLQPRFTTPSSFEVMDASGPLLWVRNPGSVADRGRPESLRVIPAKAGISVSCHRRICKQRFPLSRE